MMRNVWLCGMGLLLAACSGKGVTDSTTPPVVPDTTTNPGGTVQRTSLTVRVQFDPADASLASAAGITAAGLTVRLSRAGVNEAPRTATTDATGTVRFDALLDGQYTASVERTLSAAELARLAPADRDASVFAGGTTTAVSPPNAPSSTVSLVAARRGSLVISEFFNFYGSPTIYNWGSYIEIYNNGDSVAYLDGMYLAYTSYLAQHTDNWANCDAAAYRAVREDTTHLWVIGGVQFPGSGSDFPVPPGTARVYAADAIDHRTASGTGNVADLSAAHFEHVGNSADTDNPVAANVLPRFGVTIGAGGRGLRGEAPASWVLVKSVAATQLAQLTLPAINPAPPGGVARGPVQFWGIPRDDILDVFSLDHSPDYKAYLATTTLRYTQCQPWLPSVFERAAAEVNDYTFRPGSIRRRSLGRLMDGREVLMRTRTSARDLEVTTNLLERSLNRGR